MERARLVFRNAAVSIQQALLTILHVLDLCTDESSSYVCLSFDIDTIKIRTSQRSIVTLGAFKYRYLYREERDLWIRDVDFFS